VLVGRGLRELLFGIPMFDPVTLVATTLILVFCSALALLLPVRRVTRVDPVAVLR
jgi:ABC-type antimicrobial peptide transport system permease subunit